MVNEPREVDIRGFRWLVRNIMHLLNEHDVTVDDVLDVIERPYLTFRSLDNRASSHVIVGRDGRARSLILYVSETNERGRWFVHTGWESELAHRLLEQEGLL